MFVEDLVLLRRAGIHSGLHLSILNIIHPRDVGCACERIAHAHSFDLHLPCVALSAFGVGRAKGGLQ